MDQKKKSRMIFIAFILFIFLLPFSPFLLLSGGEIVLYAYYSMRSDISEFFDVKDIALLESGGQIDSSHPRIAGADTVCLFPRYSFISGEAHTCPIQASIVLSHMRGIEFIGVVKGSSCRLYWTSGFGESVVKHNSNSWCRKVGPNFRMTVHTEGGVKQLKLVEGKPAN